VNSTTVSCRWAGDGHMGATASTGMRASEPESPRRQPTRVRPGKTYIDLEDEKVVADVILALRAGDHGELAYRSYRTLKSGSASPFRNCGRGPQLQDHLGRDHRETTPLHQHPRSGAVWSIDGRRTPPTTLNVERSAVAEPFRGASLYLDHPYYGEFTRAFPPTGEDPAGDPGRDGGETASCSTS